MFKPTSWIRTATALMLSLWLAGQAMAQATDAAAPETNP